MRIDIYQTENAHTFIAVPVDEVVPEEVHSLIVVHSVPIKTVDVIKGKPLIALDPITVLADIEEDGYAVLGVGVLFH